MIDPQPASGADAFARALLDRNRAEAFRIARAILPRGVGHLYEDVIRPSMQQIGALWHQNRITVADEHAATALAQSVVASLYPEFPWPEGGPRSIVACVQGERHEFGARMVADLLTLDGWNATFLGADTPTSSLAKMVARTQPVFVALSIALPIHLPMARAAIFALRAASPGLKVVVGGRALDRLSDPQGKLGADVFARGAVDLVQRVKDWRPVITP